MPTKTRTSRRRTAAPGRIGDPRTIRNPYARVRGGSRRPVAPTDLCAVLDRTAERYEPRMIVLGSEPLAWDNMARWSILYRCRYGSGHEGRELHARDVITATRTGAIEALQRLLVGCNVERVELFVVRPPLTRAQVEEINAWNEDLEAERRRAGIYGQGEPRQAAIERWLTTETQRTQRETTDERG
jgi:hypothetical protein